MKYRNNLVDVTAVGDTIRKWVVTSQKRVDPTEYETPKHIRNELIADLESRRV